MPSRRVPEQREPESQVPLSDAELVARVRGGDDSAYEELYRRHADAVRRYARSCCRDAHTAEDLTGEVFARTLQAVRGGSGPDSAVRAYLLTTVRRVAASWGSTARREQLVEDFAVFAVTAAGSSASEDSLDLGADVRAMRGAEQSLAIQAFRTLPERWQTVLWHTAVEEESPSEIAPLLGLTANATAVLAHRAREGLRQAYLQAHVSTALTTGSSCARYADRLGAHARGGLRMRADRELSKHLKECERCRAAALELADVNSALKGLLPVAVIGWFAAAYAAKVAGIAAGVGVASAAGGAAAAASGAASSGGAGTGAAGGAAAEGLGAPVKAGIAAVVVVAAAGIAFAALNTGHGAPQQKPQARPAVVAPVSTPAVSPAPRPKPKPKPSPEPPRATAVPPAPKPTPEPAVDITRPQPEVTPSPTPTPAPEPTPTVTPTPPAEPTPTPSPPPAPTVFQVNQLGWSGGGDDTKPTVRLGRSSWVWDRWGLSVGGERYEHGITVGSPSSVLIDLNRGCTTYDALAGVDDLALGLGAVRFSVYGDSGRLWRSEVVRGGDPAVPVSVDIAGQQTIRLVVESADRFPFVNMADWARSRISCR
ncbi:sigma-70 family RNA polymerase sigma factor [Streptomyces sp. SPB162]|uniref:sigma-70 family RNA polymerase sigma factor n=1 Tax=Streptomyces sp. SPB162 TaxID=2940560 RepID=UPI0024064994|nr:sigma-70 family RNA polymerase sigma factor [Streptomyces sp. SPB162]